MEMTGAAARIGEKRKRGREDSDSFCDDFSQTLVCVGDSQIPSQVPNSQPAYDSKVAVTPLPVSDLVAQVAAEVAARLATTKKNKNRREAERALKTGQKGTATKKWLPFMYNFVLEKMCGLIQSGVRIDKGLEEVHLNDVAKDLFDHYGVSVCSTQVYNHLRKWRQRWLTISRPRDLSGDQWCEDSKCIILEGEHYCGQVADHPKDAEFLNVPIANYDEMHTIFSFGLATAESDRSTSMRSSCRREGDRWQEERGAFADDELVAFTNICCCEGRRTGHQGNKPTDMHPDLYNVVMDMLGFAEDDLMPSLSHLVDHKAQGSSFVGMIEPHRVL
ncbi:hypothetical protein QYE76_070101 [Lolium multiflorum]|uniref:Myb/SANT-like domain-containing protein n=1 Tax=Lolium multiflorum TaxID=4521 RepID=A0AAD8SHL7_LOLMU|nr:hypothetical protein QYE76_070101 [Lolium multiflorum]